mgnify:CR=1 FL=1
MTLPDNKLANRRAADPRKPPSWVEGYEDRPITIPGTDMPAPGFYCVRLAKGGVQVAARIWVEEERDPETGELLSDQRFFSEIDGEPPQPISGTNPWGWPWWPIFEAQYRFLVDDAAHCRRYLPDSPKANPAQPVRLAELPPLF